MANKFLHWDDVIVSRANELMTQFYFSEDRFNSWEFKFYYILSAFCLFLLIFGIFIALNALKWQVYNVNYIFVRCFKMALPCQTLVKKHLLWFICSLWNKRPSKIEHNSGNCELPDASCIEINNSEYQGLDEHDHGIYSSLQ